MNDFTHEQLCVIANKCRKCGAQLQYKVGYNNRRDFLSCTKYPACDYAYPAEAAVCLLRRANSKLTHSLEEKEN